MGDEEEQIQSQNKYNQKQKRNEEGNHDGDNDEDASASIISPTSVRDTPTLACSISSSHRDPVAVSTQRPVTPHKVDDDNGCESGDDDDDDADDDNNNTNNQNNDNNSDCNNDDGDKACDELIAAPSPVMVFETRRPETATSPCYYHSDFDFNPADPRPCFHCIDMCGAFFENLYAAQTLPFSTPQWVVNHPNFESVIRTVQSRAFPTALTAADAMVIAACMSFTLVNSGVDFSCCDFSLVRTVLHLPTTGQAERRVRNIILELTAHAAALHTSLRLQNTVQAYALLDGLANALHQFSELQTAHVIKRTEKTEKTPISIATTEMTTTTSTTMAATTGTTTTNAGPGEEDVLLEERHEAILCLQILISLAEQERNHEMLINHSQLVHVMALFVSDPLITEELLTLSLRYVAQLDTFIAAAYDISPRNLLADIVISIMEQCSRIPPTSLICPMFLPARPDDRFVDDIARIALAFAHNLASRDDFNARRLFSVVAHVAMQIEPGAIPISTDTPRYDVTVLADIALALARACPARAVTHQLFLRAVAALTVHPDAAPSALEALHVLQQSFSATSVSQNHTPPPPPFLLHQQQHSYTQPLPLSLSLSNHQPHSHLQQHQLSPPGESATRNS